MEQVGEETCEHQGKKRARVESVDSDCSLPESKRVQADPCELEVYLHGANKIRQDLFDILSDSDIVTDTDPEIQGLESVMRSFEDEILLRPGVEVAPGSDLDESLPDLGFLLEASDNDLGIPPTAGTPAREEASGTVNLLEIGSDSALFQDGLEFQDEIPSYDSFLFWIGEEPHTDVPDGDFVTADGLFSYGFEPSDAALFREEL
ncbi:hypothetical protein Nepgr_019303 [Nepenthes gracilis]|uniref:Uncharacterized protein n=1 Tax=Nepenthes gracilis TaxID=150966 RepID=A0AAD3SVP2_NEPGR|nr:hypothetical protein Nepgr_019303 [Nepenthes gracilis]